MKAIDAMAIVVLAIVHLYNFDSLSNKQCSFKIDVNQLFYQSEKKSPFWFSKNI